MSLIKHKTLTKLFPKRFIQIAVFLLPERYDIFRWDLKR